MNRDVYQCPLAIIEITEVGTFLQQLDSKTSQRKVHTPSSQTRSHENDYTSHSSEQVTATDGMEKSESISSQSLKLERPHSDDKTSDHTEIPESNHEILQKEDLTVMPDSTVTLIDLEMTEFRSHRRNLVSGDACVGSQL